MGMIHSLPQGTPVYGVDVGNGYGKVSILRVMNEDPSFLLPDSLRAGMPSTAYVSTDGSIQVYGAKNKAATRAIEAVKTYLKDEYIERVDRGKVIRVSPKDVYAAIARDLVSLANQERKARGEEPVYRVILTYPACFRDDPQKLATLKQCVEKVALEGHKLEVCGMLSEPAAVAVDYLYYIRNLAEQPVKATQYTVLVYDLGHGTFDAAVVTAYTDKEKDCDLICQSGDAEVGGKNFDKLLFKELVAQIFQRAGKDANFNRESLRNLTVDMKHALSNPDGTVVERDFAVGDDEVLLRVTREMFEHLIAGEINKTLEVTQSLLDEAKEQGVSVDAIVLSGGSGRIPMIRQALLELTDNTLPVTVYRPSEGVTFGAARYAHDLYREKTVSPEEPPKNTKTETKKAANKTIPAPILTQHCERSSGIALDDTVYLLLNENAELPCKSEEFLFTSSSSGHSEFVLKHAIHRTKDATEVKVSDCYETCRLHLNLPPNQSCKLVMKMDENRFVSIECTLPDGKVLCASAGGKGE